MTSTPFGAIREKICRPRWNNGDLRNGDDAFSARALAPKSPSQVRRAALSSGQILEETHAEHRWPAGRGISGAGIELWPCRCAKQDHYRRRRRCLSLLLADGVGAPTRRIRQGRTRG